MTIAAALGVVRSVPMALAFGRCARGGGWCATVSRFAAIGGASLRLCGSRSVHLFGRAEPAARALMEVSS